VPLSFLGDGDYRAAFVRDPKDNPTAVEMEPSATARRDQSLKIELAAGGGFVGRFNSTDHKARK